MAHTRIVDKDARIIAQCAAGKFQRNISSQTFSIATDRAANDADSLLMASVIRNETAYKGIFVAPCACKVLGVFVNGSPYVDMDVNGTVYLQVLKAVIGGSDTVLLTDNSNSGIAIGSATVPTLDTALDGSLSTTAGVVDLLVGQNVYARVVVSNHAVEAIGYVTATVEWIATDTSFSGS